MTRIDTSRQASTPSRAVLRLGLLVAGLLLIAATAAGCGESDAEKAQTPGLRRPRRPEASRSTSWPRSLPRLRRPTACRRTSNAIQNDLNEIKDAQGDLNDDRKQEVESATQEFASQVQAVASDLGSNLSASGAEAQLQSCRPRSWQAAYQQTFAQIDCD